MVSDRKEEIRLMVSAKTSFRNELEAVDYTVADDGVTLILKGSLGEM